MRISLATNFDDGLVDRLRGLPVTELFGKLSRDAAGGGRASYQIEAISRRRLARHVRWARDAGIGFSYLLNAACLDNMESTRRGQRELRGLLSWIDDIGVGSVTVASPFLLKVVKTCRPRLRVRVSVFAAVDHVRKARMWEELGADCVMLDSLLVNRELETLAAIRKAVGCELQLLVNNHCLQSCAFSGSHMTALAHASQSGHRSRGFLIDWCLLKCTEMKLADPVHYIRAEWIRPEDLRHYEAIGYDSFKITERGAPTEVLVRRVQAYAARRYDGNLLDLVQPYGFRAVAGGPFPSAAGLFGRLRHLLRPFAADPRRLWSLKRLAEERGMLRPLPDPAPVHVDNRALDGFFDRFLAQGCREVDCERCRHCHRWAEKAVRIDPAHRDRCLSLYRTVFDDLHTGRMWGLRAPASSARQGDVP